MRSVRKAHTEHLVQYQKEADDVDWCQHVDLVGVKYWCSDLLQSTTKFTPVNIPTFGFSENMDTHADDLHGYPELYPEAVP